MAEVVQNGVELMAYIPISNMDLFMWISKNGSGTLA
ncbi:hypothetical protein F9279_22755 [Bacillus sp. B1-b2]|nr:hypothetical protein F9279_22755 [Bacillus sp. B1-b2]